MTLPSGMNPRFAPMSAIPATAMSATRPNLFWPTGDTTTAPHSEVAKFHAAREYIPKCSCKHPPAAEHRDVNDGAATSPCPSLTSAVMHKTSGTGKRGHSIGGPTPPVATEGGSASSNPPPPPPTTPTHTHTHTRARARARSWRPRTPTTTHKQRQGGCPHK